MLPNSHSYSILFGNRFNIGTQITHSFRYSKRLTHVSTSLFLYMFILLQSETTISQLSLSTFLFDCDDKLPGPYRLFLCILIHIYNKILPCLNRLFLHNYSITMKVVTMPLFLHIFFYLHLGITILKQYFSKFHSITVSDYHVSTVHVHSRLLLSLNEVKRTKIIY